MSLAVTAAWIFIWITGVNTAATYSWPQMLFSVLYVFTTWVYILTVLGYARRRLNFSNRFLAYAGPASLPFYIIHVTVLVAIGYFVVQWNIPAWAKFLLIVAFSFVAIVLIYEFIIRRVNAIRLLFGMRTIPKKGKKQPT